MYNVLYSTYMYNVHYYQVNWAVVGVRSPLFYVCPTSPENTPPLPHTASDLDHLRDRPMEGERENLSTCIFVYPVHTLHSSEVVVHQLIVKGTIEVGNVILEHRKDILHC